MKDLKEINLAALVGCLISVLLVWVVAHSLPSWSEVGLLAFIVVGLNITIVTADKAGLAKTK